MQSTAIRYNVILSTEILTVRMEINQSVTKTVHEFPSQRTLFGLKLTCRGGIQGLCKALLR